MRVFTRGRGMDIFSLKNLVVFIFALSLLFFGALSVEAADLTASGVAPQVNFQDTDTGLYEWTIVTDSNLFFIRTWDGGAWKRALSIEGGARDYSLYIEDGGQIGFGTNEPLEDLHIVSSTPSVRLDDNSSSVWDIEQNGDDLRFYNVTDGVEVMTLEDSNNFVGIGDSNPDAKLHVRDSTGKAKILVEEGSTNTESTLFELTNYGGLRFNFRNYTAGITWSFFNRDDGKLAIGRPDVAGSEFLLSKTGNLTIKGTLTENSSRSLKENFVTVDGQSVLEKLDKLSILCWNYKYSTKDDNHMGPVAEDFFKPFALGKDDKHIAPRDLAGVVLAGVKALNSELPAFKAKLAQKDVEIKLLQERLASMEIMLKRMAGGAPLQVARLDK